MKLLPIFVFLIFLSNAAFAQDSFDRMNVKAKLETHALTIDKIEDQLLNDAISQDSIIEIRRTLKTEREAILDLSEEIKPALQSVKADINDLGPEPEGENAKPEPENIKAQRAALNEQAMAREGLIKEAEALESKSSRLLEQIVSLRRGQFISKIFEPQISMFDKNLWGNAYQAYATQISRLTAINTNNLPLKIAPIFLVIAALFGAMMASAKWLNRKLRSEQADTLASVSGSLMLPLLGAFLCTFFMHHVLQYQLILTDLNEAFIHHIMMLLGFYFVGILASDRLSEAGLIRKNTKSLIIMSATIFVFDALILETGRFIGTPVELAIAQSYITTSLFAVVLGICAFLALHTPKKDIKYFIPKNFFYVLCGLSIFILSANIFGYAALSRFIFERLVLIFALFAAAMLIRGFIRPYFSKLDRMLQSEENKAQNQEENLVSFWLSLFLDTLLFLIFLPLIASLFGAEWSDIREWARDAFFGFEVGNMTISIAHIGTAIGVFLALLFVTRLIQNVLSSKILPKTKMEASISQSITQVLGYIGLIIALLAGISAIGFDLTNLALIAGALSVGIGFGLQSIVSNFVSGLILLFERPIKVDDWVITSSGEGIVKKISVRATEIETFDRTSIIVPNAELISSSVKNWTHKDKVGRVVITVGVSYDSDPHKVSDVLLKCAQDYPQTLKSPEPTIHFKDFADSALIFDVRFFIRNVKDTYIASTTMRFDIWDALKAEGIEISYPQRDLHIRSAPGLKEILREK